MEKRKVSMIMPVDLLGKLDMFAEEMGMNRTAVTIWILRSYLVNKEKMTKQVLESDELVDSIAEVLERVKSKAE